MSESSIALFVKFTDEDKFEDVLEIFEDASEFISESEQESFFHDYLKKIDKTMGMDFDSWWIPEYVNTNGTMLILILNGSPSGTKEQDVITWLKKMGANSITGNMVIDGGGDVEEVDI